MPANAMSWSNSKTVSTAMACYQSPEYHGARTIRQKYADADFIIIDGVAD